MGGYDMLKRTAVEMTGEVKECEGGNNREKELARMKLRSCVAHAYLLLVVNNTKSQQPLITQHHAT
jgi:phage tail tube protein FII